MGAILPASLDKLEQHEIHTDYNAKTLAKFVADTRESQGAELANAQSIFRELCAALRVKPPKLKSAGADNAYVFEADVIDAGKSRRMDVYLRGHFVFESKQGVDPGAKNVPKGPRGAGVRGTDGWLQRMTAGRVQVGRYAVAAAKRGDPKPPFILLADLGHRLWIWSSWTKDAVDDYGDFEEGAGFAWGDLTKPELFRYLRLLFDRPEELNEEARGQRITATIAEKVCDLAVALEKRGEKAEVVGDFLMKCVFTMFAEDVSLLPPKTFSNLLDRWIDDKKAGKKETFVRGLRALWKRMDAGGDLDTGERLRQFNGYLFKEHEPIDLSIPELEALRGAARADWRKVSPAIFGTLLERALTRGERAKLGAYYTPEPYIQRLVDQTILAPLRAEWVLVRAEMERARQTAKSTAEGRKKVIKLGSDYRTKLATLRVLDPACGSGNFLYVAMRDLKRLEAEVERVLLATGGYQQPFDFEGSSVHPVQFYGIELKPWAAKIAELVLWIGYLQWQTSAGRLGLMKDPLIKDLHHIENRDALITWKRIRPLVKDGQPVLRASGVTDKRADRKMVPVDEYVGVQVAEWPAVEYVVGNPPFLGNKSMNDVLGAGYVEAIKGAFPEVNGDADLVMWWWWRAADLAAKGKLKRFGFVTTNSITHTSDRAVVVDAVQEKGVRLVYAIPDHPWYDEGAAVRIAMTVATTEKVTPVLGKVVDESRTRAAELGMVRVEERAVEEVHPDLSAGANVVGAVPLNANKGICYQGMNLVGDFRVSREDLAAMSYTPKKLPRVVHPYVIGRDLVQRPVERYVIDFCGLEPNEARTEFTPLWNRLAKVVKPAREKNNRENYRKNWWLFGEGRPGMRRALADLPRYIATPETAKHRIFQFLPAGTTPDHTVYAIASDDAFVLGVLSSRAHVTWALAAGSRLGVGNDPRWRNLVCFDPFPFPDATVAQRAEIAQLGEALDAHRKARQKADAELALTDIYNVLVKMRASQPLTDDEESLRERAMIDTLRDLHDQLDEAVFKTYGWSKDLSDAEILTHFVALNAARAAEEAKGAVRWVRPTFQAPGAIVQVTTPTAPTKGPKPKGPKPAARPKWPKADPPKYALVLDVLAAFEGSASLEEIIGAIDGTDTSDVVNVLACLAAAQRTAYVDDGDGPRWILRA